MTNVINHSPAFIVSRLISGLGLVTSPYQIFSPSEPDNPDYIITVQDTEGLDNGRTQTGERNELYGFQVRVRARGPDESYLKAGTIALALDGVHQRDVVISGTTYLVVTIIRRGKVINIGRDETSRRHITTFNALALIRQR